jgi:cysteine synthase A
MPNDMAIEKSDLLLKLGAEVERVRPAPIVDQKQFVNLARARAAEHTASTEKPGRGLFADQFETEANWRAHFTGTGPEIYEQTGGHLDAFVSGAGTGGTISGVALFLKSKLPELKVVLVVDCTTASSSALCSIRKKEKEHVGDIRSIRSLKGSGSTG